MALARYDVRAFDLNGNLIMDPTVRVRRMAAGMPRPQLFADPDGLIPLGNPVTFDEGTYGGKGWFHVEGGFYEIRVTSASHPGFEDIIEWKAIGTLQAFDFGAGGLLETRPDAVVESIEDRDAYDDQQANFGVLVESDSGRDNLPILYYKLSDTSADWSTGIVFPSVRLKAGLSFKLDVGDDIIQTGPCHDQPVTFPCRIDGWQITTRGTGGISVDIRKVASLAAWPPSEGDSITGGNPMAVGSGNAYASDTVLDNWSPDLALGQQLEFNVLSSDVSSATITLFVTRL